MTRTSLLSHCPAGRFPTRQTFSPFRVAVASKCLYFSFPFRRFPCRAANVAIRRQWAAAPFAPFPVPRNVPSGVRASARRGGFCVAVARRALRSFSQYHHLQKSNYDMLKILLKILQKIEQGAPL